MIWVHGRPHDARMAWDHEETAMRERPLHRLDCPCAQCVPPVEPTGAHLLGLAVLLTLGVLALVLL